jgi:type VI secretion system secreted protein Hcp
MAQCDMYLKIDGIDGESEDAKHKNEIQIDSYSLGAANSGSSVMGSGSGTGKVQFQDFSFQKVVDKSSPALAKYCANGKHITTTVLTVRKAGENPQEYLIITMTESIVSSYQHSGHNGGGLPLESVTLNFSKIKYDYKPQQKDGTLGALVTMTADLKTNTFT